MFLRQILSFLIVFLIAFNLSSLHTYAASLTMPDQPATSPEDNSDKGANSAIEAGEDAAASEDAAAGEDAATGEDTAATEDAHDDSNSSEAGGINPQEQNNQSSTIIVDERDIRLEFVSTTAPANAYYTLSNDDYFTIIHEETFTNTGYGAVENIIIKVPLMDKNTPNYMQFLWEYLDPYPQSIETDEYGKRLATFYLPQVAAGQTITFRQTYVVQTNSISYQQLSQNTATGYSQYIDPKYLQSEINIESDHPSIIEFAQTAAGQAFSIYNKARNSFSAVNLHLTYTDDEQANDSALVALERGKGVCEDYSNFYVAALRALGVASRVQSGYLYLPATHNSPEYYLPDGESINLTDLRHTWVEFDMPGLGWVMADPTFTYSYNLNGVSSKFINWDYFANITDDRKYIFLSEANAYDDAIHISYERGNGYLLGVFFSSLKPGYETARFADTVNHWAEDMITALSIGDNALLQGMGDNIFGVNQPMTRAQAVVSLQRYLNSPTARPDFVDVPLTHWAFFDIGAAQTAGWISGYPNKTFLPNNSISRAEMAQLLVNVFELSMPETQPIDQDAHSELPLTELEQALGSSDNNLNEAATATHPEHNLLGDAAADDSDKTTTEATITTEADMADDSNTDPVNSELLTPAMPFSDLGSEQYGWADQAILILEALGITQGNSDGTFAPERPVTRAEFAAFLYRILALEQID